MSPAELVDQLRRLGIERTERALTDWRQKRLLPPLRKTGLGRGRGTTQGWNQSVLGQAIAAHYLLTRHGRADAVRLRLWLSGYCVDARPAQKAWISCLKRDLASVRRAASHSKNSYLAVGRSLWRSVSQDRNCIPSPRKTIDDLIAGQEGETGPVERSHRQRVATAVADWLGWQDKECGPDEAAYQQTIREFIGTTIEWCYDDNEREDEAFRNRLAEALTSLNESNYKTVVPPVELYNLVETFWRRVDFSTIIRPESLIEFVRSLSAFELDSARRSLAEVREVIEHFLDLLNSSMPRTSCVRKQLDVMDGLGPFLAPAMISLKRQNPNWPLEESISTLHAFLMGVKSEDLLNKNSALFSQRVHLEWQTTKQILAQLWDPILAATQEEEQL